MNRTELVAAMAEKTQLKFLKEQQEKEETHRQVKQ